MSIRKKGKFNTLKTLLSMSVESYKWSLFWVLDIFNKQKHSTIYIFSTYGDNFFDRNGHHSQMK